MTCGCDPKEADIDRCPSVDVFLIPCEYRGTAIGQGEPKGATYSFVAEAGKIYEINYPGGDLLYIAEIEADERAVTDTGGLDPDDPARLQPAPAPEDAPAAESPAVVDAPAPEPAPTAIAGEPAEAETMLPVSGQGAESKAVFIVVGIGVILLLIAGGVMAARRREYPA